MLKADISHIDEFGVFISPATMLEALLDYLSQIADPSPSLPLSKECFPWRHSSYGILPRKQDVYFIT